MIRFIKNNWPVAIVLALCFWAVKALFVPGFFPVHDDEQIGRLFELNWVLRDGQIPARWIPHLGFGFGYPFFNFYPPFVYYFGEVFHLLGFSFINSTKAVIFTGFLSSSLFMYLWVKNHFGKLAGVFSALLYTYASYHSVDVFVRGDIPEFFSFVWIPAVFLLVDLLFNTQKIKHALVLSILLSLLVLTHSLIAFPFLFFFLLYVFFQLFSVRSSFSRNFFLIFSSSIVAFLLSMFFWLPVFLEKKYTLVDGILTKELANYQLHFVYLRQLWNSAWGYGGSIPGIFDGLSFEVGKIPLILSVLLILIILFSFLIKRKISRDPKLIIFIFFLLMLSIYMTSFYSQWIWDRVQLLSYLQFPWRFLIFAVVFSSFLGGAFIKFVEDKFGKPLSVGLFIVLGIIIIVSESPKFQPASFLNVNDSFYTNKQDLEWRVSKMSFEFVPKGVATKLSDIKTTQIDLSQKDIPTQPFKVIKGIAVVKILSDKSNFKEFLVESKDISILQINTFSFPGWIIKMDGKPMQYNDNNKLKLITINIPNGSHHVIAEFTNTPARGVGNAVSLVVFLNIIGFGLFKIWKK